MDASVVRDDGNGTGSDRAWRDAVAWIERHG